MKKFTFALMALLAFTFTLKAQQFVSTEPANRNVVIEEFTGRNCGYCPIGHRITHELMEEYPGRVFAINVHCTGLSPTTYPNLNITKGNSIANGFNFDGIPMGMVNRHSGTAAETSQFASLTNTQLNQAAECNVGGSVVVNPETRVATITVEVYYTASSSQSTNYLTIAMVQDSIIGAQSDYGNYNPGGWVATGQYAHMHALRDIITTNLWGDEVAPTTQGSLVTFNYTYEIPETIGSPNGVEVDLDNIHFLAFVTERYQGTPTRPVLNACQLDLVQGVDAPIYPIIAGVNQVGGSTCTHTKNMEVKVQNIGTETLTSMVLEVEFEGNTQTINWQGELPSFGMEKIETTLEVPFGNYPVNVTLTEANGQPLDKHDTGMVECLEWVGLEIEGEVEVIRLELMQDKFGNQITWEFTTPNGTVLGSGGPYALLPAGNGTQLHIEQVTIPVDECVKFTIYDQVGNGICCSNGQGYYIVKDSQGNVIFGNENDGEFGESASHLISVRNHQTTVEVGGTEAVNVDYTHADFVSSLVYEVYPDQVGFECRKVTSSEPMIIPGILNEFQKILGTTDELEHSTIYVVRAFAVVNGETYYGAETTFQTWTEGVDEFGESVKIYPNPTSGVLNIQGEGLKSIEVYNTIGQCVMMQEVNGDGIQLNTESLNNGIYFLRVRANDGTLLNRTFSVAR